MVQRLFRIFRFSGLAAVLFVIATLVSPDATAAAGNSPVGVWKTIDDESGKAKSHVKIYERDGKLYGKVTKLLLRPGAKCDACEGDDKGKPIEGMVVVWGLKQDGDEWEGGKIFDPKKGKTYRCKMWIEGGKLKVRGYAGPFFRTQTWHRIK
jgi:uncharacterized protein (DUF2147 family)